jgi:glycosyltransferase involved in cell wall biosynthesis
VASLTPRKGHDTLLDALERIVDLDWHLTCVGGALGTEQWASTIRHRGEAGRLAGRVTFAGELTGDALDRAFDAADLFVLPTRYEGYGMAIAEALGRGLPVISTDTGGIADLVGDTAGFVIGADDPSALAGVIRLFMTDRMVRTRMRQGAERSRARLRSWEAAAVEMDAALRRFAAS